MRIITLFMLILCWISVPLHAAEISCAGPTSGGCSVGLLRGEISKGDHEKVAAFVRANYSAIAKFGLVSSGGDADEALKIGRLFRKYLIETDAPLEMGDGTWGLILGEMWNCRSQDCGRCASACALIWFGGVDRFGTVGLHRPRVNDPMFSGLSAADASTVYRQALGRIAAYLDEMEVPKPIIESMITTSSDDIRWVDSFDDDLGRPPSLAEWEDASCGSGNNNDRGIAVATPKQRDAIQNKELCKTLLFDNRRGRLAPP